LEKIKYEKNGHNYTQIQVVDKLIEKYNKFKKYEK